MGQHKFNPVAQAAKEGKIPPKPRKKGISAGSLVALAAAAYAPIFREIVIAPEPPAKIRTWKELSGMVSQDGRYRIEVDLEAGNGQIVPTFEVPDGEYWDHHEYLSTHTFYEKTHLYYTAILQRFGFNVELVSWG